jgi:Flp pilus assembly protein TadB
VAILAWYIPGVLLENLAAARWRLVDREAYALTNLLRFLLPVKAHPLTALRELVDEIQAPLADWIRDALGREAAAEEPVEDALQRIARRLQHAELELLAEILRADRRERSVEPLLKELLDAWTERIRMDERQLGRLATARRFTNLIIGGPLIGYVLMGAVAPGTMHTFAGSVAGQAVGGVGMLLMVFGAYVARSTIRRAQRGVLAG